MAKCSRKPRSAWMPTLRFLVAITMLGGTSAFIRRSQSTDSVDIVNEIPNGDIRVHCRSGETDQGEHFLPQDADYKFEFNINYMSNIPIYRCTVSNLLTGQHRAGLEVWSTYVFDKSPCVAKCLWFVRPDGFYVTDFSYLTAPQSVPEPKFMAPWPAKVSRNSWPVMDEQIPQEGLDLSPYGYLTEFTRRLLPFPARHRVIPLESPSGEVLKSL